MTKHPDNKPQYWQFYWPLAVTGILLLLGQQFQNGALARYPNAVRELAVFAFAMSTFSLFLAPLGFLPQMVNVLGRSAAAQRKCLLFTLCTSSLLTLPVLAFAFVPRCSGILALAFDIRGEVLDTVILYLKRLSPLIVVQALFQYYAGLLVQDKRTGMITLLHLLRMTILIGILILGFHAGWAPAIALTRASFWSGVTKLVLIYFLKKKFYCLPNEQSDHNLSYRQILDFYWPVALTSIMFSMSRPILYSFVSRTQNSEATIASLRIAFAFALIFHNPLNQFRHMFVTFGNTDLSGLRRFMVRALLITVAAIILILTTPLSRLVLQSLLGVKGEVLHMSRQVLWVLISVPIVVTLRNYYHGLAMVGRRTLSMSAGSITRNVSIYVSAYAFYQAGMLNHVAAAICLALGFTAEALTVACSAVWQRHRQASKGDNQ